jgi:hypothetical protein
MKWQRRAVDAGELGISDVENSYQAWRNHASHGDSYHLTCATDELFKNIFKESAKYGAKTK